MKPLNGKCAMTREEKNARRRELDADPFHRALSNKRQRAWRERNRERLNAKRRADYAENLEREHARQKAWREANPDKRRASWKKWADANRDRLRARDAARYATAADKARRDRKIAAHRQRMANDPEYRARVNATKRAYYHKIKNGAKFLRWYLRCELIPRWRKIESEEDECRYLSRCNDRTRQLYMLWKRDTYGALRKLLKEEGRK